MKFRNVAFLAAIASSAQASVIHSYSLVPLMERADNYELTLTRILNFKQAKYYNDKTSKFWVNGTAGALPLVNWTVSDSYAGLLPISDRADETGKLYFWFWPSSGGKETEDDIVVWFQGGPGCSGLRAFLQENGPISYKPGMDAPAPNPYSWNKLANVVWMEQPISTGFTQGNKSAHDYVDIAHQFMGFWKQFLDTFGDLKGKRVWFTGESAGGFFVPYTTNAFFKANNTTYYNARGLMMNDPWIDQFDASLFVDQLAYVEYAKQWKNLLGFSENFMRNLTAASKKCGYEELARKALSYPPPKDLVYRVIAKHGDDGWIPAECDLGSTIEDELIRKNPCFNPYRASDLCPKFSSGANLDPYFQRRDVQDAIHAPHVDWQSCIPWGDSVFIEPYNLENLRGTIAQQLPECIAKSERVIIANGDMDFLNAPQGVLMSIQNMTWGGLQGFQKKPSKRFIVDHEDQGDMGTWTEERGLTWAQVKLAGHMLPGDQPGAAYQLLEYLLGRIKTLSGTKSTPSSVEL